MNQIAFDLGFLRIHWYGVLVALGFVAGTWTASRRSARVGVAPETTFDMMPWLIVGALIGARAWYVMAFWRQDFAQQPLTEIFMIHHGGLVFYGGLVGAAFAGVWFVRRRKLAHWTVADILAPSIALGHVFGRIGCLMNGCCYGSPTSLPWAVHFPAEHATHGVGVHPTQIYEALLNLALYGGLVWLFRRRRFPGQVFAAYLIAYAVVRSIVECFRGDSAVRFLGGWATPAHFFSGVILVTGVVLWVLLSRDVSVATPAARK